MHSCTFVKYGLTFLFCSIAIHWMRYCQWLVQLQAHIQTIYCSFFAALIAVNAPAPDEYLGVSTFCENLGPSKCCMYRKFLIRCCHLRVIVILYVSLPVHITFFSLHLESLKDCLAKDYKNVVFSCLSGTHPDAGGMGIKEGIPTQSQDDSKRIHMDSIQVGQCHAQYMENHWDKEIVQLDEQWVVFHLACEIQQYAWFQHNSSDHLLQCYMQEMHVTLLCYMYHHIAERCSLTGALVDCTLNTCIAHDSTRDVSFKYINGVYFFVITMITDLCINIHVLVTLVLNIQMIALCLSFFQYQVDVCLYMYSIYFPCVPLCCCCTLPAKCRRHLDIQKVGGGTNQRVCCNICDCDEFCG